MRRPTALGFLAAGLVLQLAGPPSAGGAEPDAARAAVRARLGVPAGWPDRLDLTDSEPLPTDAPDAPGVGSLDEPFAIGEALYDPARVEDGVRSLLRLMQVTVVADDAPPAPPAPPAPDAAPFVLAEGEVRALIRMGIADAERMAEEEAPPLTFADLHRAVAPALSGVGVDELARLYATAYENRPEDLAPQVLMGQPITAEMPLLRPQLWLLLVDGFAAPARARLASTVARASFVRTASVGAPGWGTAWAAMPPTRSPDPRYSPDEWEELVARLTIWIARSAPPVTPVAAAAHEGHGGPGQPVRFEVQLPAQGRRMVSARGRVLIEPRASPARSSIPARWWYKDEATLRSHGSPTPAHRAPVRPDAGGKLVFSFTPKRERAENRGRVVSEKVLVEVQFDMAAYVAAYYDLSPALRGLTFSAISDVVYTIPEGELTIEWHEEEALDIWLVNRYDVALSLGGLAQGTRKGEDRASGTLVRGEDGIWEGYFEASARAIQKMSGLGTNPCPSKESHKLQQLHVRGVPVGGPGLIRGASDFAWVSGRPGAEVLRLEFLPASPPRVRQGKRDPCQPNIGSTRNGGWYIPLNDAVWTIPEGGYPLLLPDEGRLVYEDWSSIETIAGESVWFVTVERHRAEP